MMQPQDMEFFLNLQKFALLFTFVVGLAIIAGSVALCFIAMHMSAIRGELLKLRVEAEMTTERARRGKPSE